MLMCIRPMYPPISAVILCFVKALKEPIMVAEVVCHDEPYCATVMLNHLRNHGQYIYIFIYYIDTSSRIYTEHRHNFYFYEPWIEVPTKRLNVTVRNVDNLCKVSLTFLIISSLIQEQKNFHSYKIFPLFISFIILILLMQILFPYIENK